LNNPIVSVIVTTYQRRELAELAITSAMNQDYENLEIIVIEDGSNSGIKEWLQGYNSKRIKYCNNGINSGLAACRNKGVEIANGKYVSFLDDDDAWLPDKISSQIGIIPGNESSKLSVTCGTCLIQNGTVKRKFIPQIQGSLFEHVFKGGGFPPSSLLVAKDIILEIGGFSEDLKSCVDHDFWMKLGLAKCKMLCVPNGQVYTNRSNQDHMKSDIQNRIKGIVQFYDKWFDVVNEDTKIGDWRKIERVYESQTYQTLFQQYHQGNIKTKEAVSYLKNIYSQRKINIRNIIFMRMKDRILLSSFFHPITAFFINRLWKVYGLLWRSQQKIVELINSFLTLKMRKGPGIG